MSGVRDATERSDALVLFGVTGDLAYKMIFPALYAMVKRGRLTMPVIGVAYSQWSLEQLKQRAEDSVKHHGTLDDPKAFDRLLSSLRYVDGNYEDAATFVALKKAIGAAKRPAHYLAIPPALFATVIKGLGASGLDKDARVIVEKPFGAAIWPPPALSIALRYRCSTKSRYSASITFSARKRS